MKPKLRVWVTFGEDLKFGDGRGRWPGQRHAADRRGAALSRPLPHISPRARDLHAAALRANVQTDEGDTPHDVHTMNPGEIFVAGKWQAPASGETYRPINPANEEPPAEGGKGDERDIDAAVTAARKAFDSGPWPKMSAHERGRIVWRLGDLITKNLEEMARLESLCTGKTMF